MTPDTGHVDRGGYAGRWSGPTAAVRAVRPACGFREWRMGREDQIQRWMQQSRRLRVGDCRVDLSLNEIQRGEETVRLTPKAAGVLEVLLFIAGQPASRERLLAEVWRGEFPTDDVVTQAIGELRRAFGDDPRTAAYIRTLPRVGYALVAPVEPYAAAP